MEELRNLPGHVPGRARHRTGGCGAEVQAVQLEQFAQFDDRGGMVVDPQIDITVQVTAIAPLFFGHVQCGRLLAPAISSLGLSRLQSLEQPLRQRSGRTLEVVGHGPDDGFRCQDVPLATVPVPRPVAGPVEALFSSPRGRAAVLVDDTQLAVLAVTVRFREAAHDIAGGLPFGEQGQPPRTITQVGPRLGGDGACAGPRPRDNRPNGQELAGHPTPNSPVWRSAAAIEKVDGVTRNCSPISALLRSVIASAEGAWRSQAVRPQSTPVMSLGISSVPRNRLQSPRWYPNGGSRPRRPHRSQARRT